MYISGELAKLCIYLHILYLVLAEPDIALVALLETAVDLSLVLNVFDIYHKAGIMALCHHSCIFSCGDKVACCFSLVAELGIAVDLCVPFFEPYILYLLAALDFYTIYLLEDILKIEGVSAIE